MNFMHKFKHIAYIATHRIYLMIKLTHLSIAVAIGITLTACGGGGSSETQANQVTRYTKQVTVETTSTSNDVVPLANATRARSRTFFEQQNRN